MATAIKKQANEERHYVSSEDLPFHCPPGPRRWDYHPSVSLAFDKTTGEATCSYCGAKYILMDFKKQN